MVLLLLLACASEPDVAAPPPPTVDETVTAVRQGLSAAHRSWSAGQLDEAADEVRQTYHQHFERLEDGLRAQNPRETLELEYAFSVLAVHLSKKGNPVDIAGEVRGLTTRVETAASTLPRTGPTPTEPPQPVQPSTVAVPVSAEQGADAPGLSNVKSED